MIGIAPCRFCERDTGVFKDKSEMFSELSNSGVYLDNFAACRPDRIVSTLDKSLLRECLSGVLFFGKVLPVDTNGLHLRFESRSLI